MTKREFKELFDKHFDALRNYVWYRSGDPDLASDIAQDVFMKLWEKQPAQNNGNIKGLLFKMAGDRFISNYRRKNVELKFKIATETVNYTGSADEKLHYDELKLQYQKALSDMPEKQRIVFLMSRKDNMKYAEIANTLGIGYKAVEKRMSKALGFLKQKIYSREYE